MCIACRKRASNKTMIPLGVSPGGSLLVGPQCLGKPISGKKVWVCPSRSCVDKVSKRPHLLARASGKDMIDITQLKESVRAQLDTEWKSSLKIANRQGLIHSGLSIFQSKDSENFIGFLFASDASDKTEPMNTINFTGFKTTLFETNKACLGALIGKGPRAVVGLRSGQATRRLIVQLQRSDSLG
jgi:predicted RNA-binding protein YlxR (DUF448 family)